MDGWIEWNFWIEWIFCLDPCGILFQSILLYSILISSILKNVSKRQKGTIGTNLLEHWQDQPPTSRMSLPVNDDWCLHGLLAYLPRCDVVPQGVEGPAHEGWLPIKAGPPGGQALGRGPQQTGPQSLPQRLSQSGLTWDGMREGERHLASKENKQRQRCSVGRKFSLQKL